VKGAIETKLGSVFSQVTSRVPFAADGVVGL
jgi:hypothetical protein